MIPGVMPDTDTDTATVIEAARRAGLALTAERAAAALPLVLAMEAADRALIELDLTEPP